MWSREGGRLRSFRCGVFGVGVLGAEIASRRMDRDPAGRWIHARAPLKHLSEARS
jgi:hypothetical protein